MKETDVFMPLYIGDYLGDTMHLTGPMHGAYLLLIMYYWRRGPLPADDSTLATIARTEMADWTETVRDPVMAFFTRDGDMLKHVGLEERKAASLDKMASLSGRGRAGAEKRWGNRVKSKPKHDAANAQAMPKNANSESESYIESKDSIASLPSEAPPTKAAQVSKRGTRLPDDWQPGEADKRFAVDLGLGPNVTADRFRDHWHAAAGATATKLDWRAAWRTWCRREVEFKGLKPSALADPEQPTPPQKFL